MVVELFLDLVVPDDLSDSADQSTWQWMIERQRVFRFNTRDRFLRLTCLGDSLQGIRKRLIQAFNVSSDVLLVVGLICSLPILFTFVSPLAIWLIGAYTRAVLEGGVFDDGGFGPREELKFLEAPSELKPEDASFEPITTSPAQANCIVCGDELKFGVIYCEDCGTPQHYDCWCYLSKCSVYGCGCKKFRVENPSGN